MISERDFELEYDPLESPSGSNIWDHAEVVSLPITQVWSIVEGDDDDNFYALAGFHIVNVVGYAVTKKHWQTGDEQAEWLIY